MTRHFWSLLHRYAGLTLTGFLIIVGLTGSLLAFLPELEHFITPQLYAVESSAKRLDPAELIAHAEALIPNSQITAISLRETDSVHISVSPRVDTATGKTDALSFDELILDPYTGQELGRRTWGAISEGVINLMPFIYKLHFNLALNDVGMWALGIAALVWTIDCFVGFYLTLPTRKKSTDTKPEQLESNAYPTKSFWKRWKPAWLIKWRGSAYRINFDLHRAAGLWLWLMLLIFAWSSVYMNLWDTVYTKATQTVFDFHAPWTDLAKLEKPLEHPAISVQQALSIGTKLMTQAATEQGFTVEQPMSYWLDRAHGVYVYSVRSNLDIQDKHGATQLFFDANTGEQRLLLLPSGQYNGNTVTAWLLALHTANVFGLPYRILVCVLGLAIIMLSVTGVIIWLRKRRSANFRSKA